jgi:hypothetical protein
MKYIYLNKNVIIYLLIFIFIFIIFVKIYHFKPTIREGKIKVPGVKDIVNTVEDEYNKAKKKVNGIVNKVKDQVTKAIKETGVIQAITNQINSVGNLIDQAIKSRQLELARKYLKNARQLALDAGARRRILNVTIAKGMEQMQEARELANDLKEDARQTAEQELQSSLDTLQQIQQGVNESVDAANRIVNQSVQAIEDLAELLDFENLLKGLLGPISKLVNTTQNSFKFLKDF